MRERLDVLLVDRHFVESRTKAQWLVRNGFVMVDGKEIKKPGKLIDNSLDACEYAKVAPEIQIIIEDNYFSIQDNGSGLPEDTIKKSLNYMTRVSDKNNYISPTRGQLGNALKCIYAAPFVYSGNSSIIEIEACGKRHSITMSKDMIQQKPKIEHKI